MGTVAASDLLDRAQQQLQDTGGGRWPRDTLLDYLNEGQHQIVVFRPAATARVVKKKLAAGTRQTLANDEVRLLKVARNMGDGSTPGRSITLIDQELLDLQRPDWHSEQQQSEVKHFVYDDRNPRTWLCYPPADGSTYVEIEVAKAPAALSENDPIDMDDTYQGALADWILFRAFSEDSQEAMEPRAEQHLQMFYQALGIKMQAARRTNPNNNAPPHPQTDAGGR